MEYVAQHVPVEVSVMIRPRGGDFTYSKAELDIMKRDIKNAAAAGAEGVLFGVLTEDGFLDVDAMGELVAIAKEHSLKVTCHRAFDRAQDPLGFAKRLVELGVDRLLTSGQKPHVTQGLGLLRQLVDGVGQDLVIMPCGHITSDIVEQVLAIGVSEVHVRRVETVRSPARCQWLVTVGDANRGENVHVRIDKTETAKIVQLVKNWGPVSLSLEAKRLQAMRAACSLPFRSYLFTFPYSGPNVWQAR